MINKFGQNSKYDFWEFDLLMDMMQLLMSRYQPKNSNVTCHACFVLFFYFIFLKKEAKSSIVAISEFFSLSWILSLYAKAKYKRQELNG